MKILYIVTHPLGIRDSLYNYKDGYVISLFDTQGDDFVGCIISQIRVAIMHYPISRIVLVSNNEDILIRLRCTFTGIDIAPVER